MSSSNKTCLYFQYRNAQPHSTDALLVATSKELTILEQLLSDAEMNSTSKLKENLALADTLLITPDRIYSATLPAESHFVSKDTIVTDRRECDKDMKKQDLTTELQEAQTKLIKSQRIFEKLDQNNITSQNAILKLKELLTFPDRIAVISKTDCNPEIKKPKFK